MPFPVPLTEPVYSRYIYVNKDTNVVHLLVPIVGGDEISTDNTCRTRYAMDEFFDPKAGALASLNKHEDALRFDLNLLNQRPKGENKNEDVAKPPEEKKEATISTQQGETKEEMQEKQKLIALKQQRLDQILIYKNALMEVQKAGYDYRKCIAALTSEPSNLDSMLLRPKDIDDDVRPVTPTFSLNRGDSNKVRQTSPLFNALHETFPSVNYAKTTTTKERISEAAIARLKQMDPPPTFEQIQQVLTEEGARISGQTFNFRKYEDKSALGTTGQLIDVPITKEYLNTVYLSEDEDYEGSVDDYVSNLLTLCVNWDAVENTNATEYKEDTVAETKDQTSSSPFFRFKSELDLPEGSTEYLVDQTIAKKTELLSIATQFCLAHINFYCKGANISTQNFGVVLDNSPDLSKELAILIAESVNNKQNVESNIIKFINQHQSEFGMNRSLTEDEEASITQRFERNFNLVSSSETHFDHMDEFLVLDREHNGKFKTHQSSIITGFANFIKQNFPNLDTSYFEDVREDSEAMPVVVPHQNESVQASVTIDDLSVLTSLVQDDKTYESLPKSTQNLLQQSMEFKLQLLLKDVVRGNQLRVESYLESQPPIKLQKLLTTPTTFTDYSGRTFNCTAFEYAFWAGDTQMCDMLKKHMDENTVKIVSERIKTIEANGGLEYVQNGHTYKSMHFSLDPLKAALNHYIANFTALRSSTNKLKEAWEQIGYAQHELPTHMMQEYCNGFQTTNSDTLKLNRNFPSFDMASNSEQFACPLDDSVNTRHLGKDYTLAQGGGTQCARRSSEQFLFKGPMNQDLDRLKAFEASNAAKLETLKDDLSAVATVTIHA